MRSMCIFDLRRLLDGGSSSWYMLTGMLGFGELGCHDNSYNVDDFWIPVIDIDENAVLLVEVSVRDCSSSRATSYISGYSIIYGSQARNSDARTIS